MAQDLGIDRATSGPSVTLLGSNLSDTTTSAVTSAVDFGTPTPIAAGYELKLDAQASANSYAYLWIVWSHDNTDFGDSSNKYLVTSVDCTASTSSVDVGEFPVLARYAKFYLENQTGGTINSAGTALALWDAFGDQV